MSGRSKSSVKSKSPSRTKSTKVSGRKLETERKRSESKDDAAPEDRSRKESQASRDLPLISQGTQDVPVQGSHGQTRRKDDSFSNESLNEPSGRPQKQKAKRHPGDERKARVNKNQNGRDKTDESNNGFDKRRRNDSKECKGSSKQRKAAEKTSDEDKAIRNSQDGSKTDDGVRRKARAPGKTEEKVKGKRRDASKNNGEKDDTHGENSAGGETRNGNKENNSINANDENSSNNDKHFSPDNDSVNKSDGSLTSNTESFSTNADDSISTNTGDSSRTNNRNSEQDEFLRMFLSTEHMERDEEDPEGRGRGSPGARRAAWQYSEEAKKKHEELIRKILEEFDLEATKQKYRNSYVVERRRDGKRYLSGFVCNGRFATTDESEITADRRHSKHLQEA